METTVYLIRHSEPMNVHNVLNTDSLQFQNEKKILSVNGELLAKSLSENKELERIDKLYSSNYVRRFRLLNILLLKIILILIL